MKELNYKVNRRNIYNKLRSSIEDLLNKYGFRCKRCKATCCIGPKRFPFLYEDFQLIQEKSPQVINENIDIFFDEEDHTGYDFEGSIKQHPNGKCVFYNEQGNVCLIHECKPLLCVSFPFVINLNAWEYFVHNSCEWIKLCYKDKPDLHDLDQKIVNMIDDYRSIKYDDEE